MNRAHDLTKAQAAGAASTPGGMGWALLASMTLACWSGPASAQHGEEADNMRLVGHNDLQGRSAYQPIIQEQNGRWIAYVGHHDGVAVNPLNGAVEENGTSIVDVTNPRRPVYLHHLPAEGMPDELGGSQMQQTCSGDELPAGEPGKYYLLRTDGNDGHEIWDVTDPSNPEFVVDVTSGLGQTHKNWWECDTGIAYLVADLTPEGFHTDRGMKIYDLSDPHNPVFIRNYVAPEARPDAPVPEREFSMHEATVMGNRVYVGYGTSSDGVCEILDRQKLLEGDPEPTEENLLFPLIGRVDMPDFMGCHTFWPLIGMDLPEYELFEEGTPRDFAVAVNEAGGNRCTQEMHQMVYFLDITDEAHPWPVSNYQVPESEGLFCDRGGRFGAHAMNWSFTDVFYRKLIAVSYFVAGARLVDVRDPFHPKEVGFYIPATTENTEELCAEIDGIEECSVSIHTNNVEVDDRGLVYLADRANTGLHIVELTGEARQLIDLPAGDEEEPVEDDAMVADLP
jgi:hypothetical protein